MAHSMASARTAPPALPTSIRFDVTEYMDRAPLAGVTVSARATVIAEWKVDVIDVPEDRPRPPGRPGQGVGGPDVTMRRRTTVQRASDGVRCETKSVATDANGVAAFIWDPTADAQFAQAWADLNGKHPGATVLVHIDAGFSLNATAPVDLFRLSPPLRNGADRRQPLYVDLAATIVGHVTESTARLWFAPARAVRGAGLTASYELFERGRPLRRARPQALTFTGSGPSLADNVYAVADVSRLKPATDYEYHAVITDGRSRWIGGRGWFRTADPTSSTCRIAFGSCNHPRDVNDLERWAAIRGWVPDVTILLGDQIYGDGIDAEGRPLDSSTSIDWVDFYDSAYRSQWRHRSIREALRRGATYMMLDDHDVADDWGTVFTTLDAEDQPRVRAAQQAFEAYQHSHNPPTPNRTTTDDSYEYSFARGPVAVFVLDERMRRGIEAGEPVLGARQWQRLRAWSQSAEVRAADVVVIASPVPLAFCDVELAEKTITSWNSAVDVVDGLGAPLWEVTDALIGWGVNDLKIDTVYHAGHMVEPDLADQWSYRTNREELGRLLDLLFDLQNDPNHRRAVIVVSGDSHVGLMHVIRSEHERHVDNNVIYQITSSPIGRAADGGLELAVEIEHAIFGSFVLTNKKGPQTSPLDTLRAGYRGTLVGSWAMRNFGSLVVERRPGAGRVYELRVALHFPRSRLLSSDEARLDLVYDLDRPGRPTPAWALPSVAFGAET